MSFKGPSIDPVSVEAGGYRLTTNHSFPKVGHRSLWKNAASKLSGRRGAWGTLSEEPGGATLGFSTISQIDTIADKVLDYLGRRDKARLSCVSRQWHQALERNNTARLAQLRTTFEAAHGRIHPNLDQLFATMPDKGLLTLEKALAGEGGLMDVGASGAGVAPGRVPPKRSAGTSRPPLRPRPISPIHPSQMTSAFASNNANQLTPINVRARSEDNAGDLPTLLSDESTGSQRTPVAPVLRTLQNATSLSQDTRNLLTRVVSANDKMSRLAVVVMQQLVEQQEMQQKMAQQAAAARTGAGPEAAMKLGYFTGSVLQQFEQAKAGVQIYHGDHVKPWFMTNDHDNFEDDLIPKKATKQVEVHWWGTFVAALYVLALIFYVVFRCMFTLALGKYLWYGILVLSVEIIGGLSILPYALMLTLSAKVVKKSEAAAAAAEEEGLKPVLSETEALVDAGVVMQYHVRVWIPCYRESLSVVSKTITAALNAKLPPGCRRSVYLCDDGKDPDKRRFMHDLGNDDCVYVSGRKRSKGETNGKSGNLNNLAKLLYPEGRAVPLSEVACIFDADQVCSWDFFLKTLPLMDAGQDVAMVLTPQAFYNAEPDADIFNHINLPFWLYTQVGYNAWEIISCTGTNFLVRAKAFMEAGMFPTYTLTEDFALGVKLKGLNWRCCYVDEFLAVGEAPMGVRNSFQQRSRWAKGHFQFFFNWKHCPVLDHNLGFLPRFVFGSVILAYFSAFLATPLLIAVPMVTVWVGVFPIIINWQAAVAVTVYYVSTCLVMFYVRDFGHLKSMWFALVSNSILWWAYVKALLRSLTGSVQFKVTAKGLHRLAASGIQDTWVSLLTWVALATTFGFSIVNLFSGPPSSPLLISMMWMVYSSIPPFLLLWYWLARRLGPRPLRWWCTLLYPVSGVTGLLGIAIIWPLLPNVYNYNTALDASVQFYGSQYSGELPQDYGQLFPKVVWRRGSPIDDEALVLSANVTGNWSVYMEQRGVVITKSELWDLSAWEEEYWGNMSVVPRQNLSGGFVTGMAGGNLKATPAIAYSTAMLAWQALSFPAQLDNVHNPQRLLPVVKAEVRQGADYLNRTLITDVRTNFSGIVSRVGHVAVEYLSWHHPDDQDMQRPAFAVPVHYGASDLFGSVAAALAAASVVFQDDDPHRASDYLRAAENAMGFGNTTLALYSRTDVDMQVLYNSTSFFDDLAWGAAWMYRATNESSWVELFNKYASLAFRYEADALASSVTDWGHVFWAANLVMSQHPLMDNKALPAFQGNVVAYLRKWMCPGTPPLAMYTKHGLAVQPNFTTLGVPAMTAFMAASLATSVNITGEDKEEYQCFALAQVRYMLGDSGQSFVAGFGKHPPTQTQDRAVACPENGHLCSAFTSLYSPRKDLYPLYGALIAGPLGVTDHVDTVRVSNSSWVGIENNVGLSGALAAVQPYPSWLWQRCQQKSGVIRINSVCGARVRVL